MPTDRGSGKGEYFHFIAPCGFFKSMASRSLGNGVMTYMLLLTTSGPPSWPCGIPVASEKTTLRFATLPVLIWLRVLKRVPARSPSGVVHSSAGNGLTVRIPGSVPGAPMVPGAACVVDCLPHPHPRAAAVTSAGTYRNRVRCRFFMTAPQRNVYKYAATSRACCSESPSVGIAVPGSTDCGDRSHRTRFSVLLGSCPAIYVRREKKNSGGPTTPRAPRTPGMV